MRDIMRSLLSANLTITGIIMFIGSLITFFGSTFLINATNLGKRLGFLVVGAGTFGWCIINSILFVMFVLALNRYEQEKTEAENTSD